MYIIAGIMIVLFAAYFFRNIWWRIITTKQNGIETEALVSRIETCKNVARGAEFISRSYYIRFQAQNGLENESRLLNPKRFLEVGSKIRIKYTDERADYAVLTEIIK